jgi:hypothetical protein
MNTFFEGPKYQISTFCISADGFYNICLPFCWENLKKVLLAPLKPLTNTENPSSNPLQEACSGFQVAACDSKKIVLKAVCDSENCAESRL